MEEMSKHGRKGKAAMRAGMSRNTARKYMSSGCLPSEMSVERTWRTRADVFSDDWCDIEKMLRDAPTLEAKTIFEDLQMRRSGIYQDGQLRTLQRRIRDWRAREGPDKEVFFSQEHRPGEAMQTDFTWATELGITINGEEYRHKLCHMVLPYSNWEWATACRSESMSAIRRGVQAAIFRLGRIPRYHQTDNSTAATHNLGSGGRDFNPEYKDLIEHLGMKARTTGIGEKEQNGDVEASNGVLKRRLEQYLLLRHNRDFSSVESYEKWLWGILEKANQGRSIRTKEELDAMRPLIVDRLVEYTEEDVRVSSWTTINVKHNVYSVPSRLIGETVRVRLYEDRLEVYFKGTLQQTMERMSGRAGHRIEYRHIIESLIRKPGGFERYRYRDDLFPTARFRAAYEVLCAAPHKDISTDLNYLKLLQLAAMTMECDVDAALELLLSAGEVPTAEAVKSLVKPRTLEKPVDMPEYEVDLSGYDKLLKAVKAA